MKGNKNVKCSKLINLKEAKINNTTITSKAIENYPIDQTVAALILKTYGRFKNKNGKKSFHC